MKNKKSLFYSLLALFLGIIIIVGGTAAMAAAADMIPDHKGSTVSVPLPDGGGAVYFEGVPGIDRLYPLNLFHPDDTVNNPTMMPEDIYSAVVNNFDWYPTDSVTAAAKDGFILLNAVGDEGSYQCVTTLNRGLLAVSSAGDDYTVTTADIEAAHNKVAESAALAQNNHTVLRQHITALISGDEIDLAKTGSPVEDFFKMYCGYTADIRDDNIGSSVPDRYIEAQYIYTLLYFGSYAAVYSDGMIFLTYTVSDFGTLTLSWSAKDLSFRGMALDARQALPVSAE